MIQNLKKYIKYKKYSSLILLLILIISCYNYSDVNKSYNLQSVFKQDLKNSYSISSSITNHDNSNNKVNNVVNEYGQQTKNILCYIPNWANYITGLNIEELLLNNNNIINFDLIHLNLLEYYLKKIEINIEADVKYIMLCFNDMVFDYYSDFVAIIDGEFDLKKINKKIIEEIENGFLSLKFQNLSPNKKEKYIFEDKNKEITFSFISNNRLIISSSKYFKQYNDLINTGKGRLEDDIFIANIKKKYDNSSIWIVYKITENFANLLYDGELKKLIKNLEFILFQTIYTNSDNKNADSKLNITLISKDKQSTKKLYNNILNQISQLIRIYNTNNKLRDLLSIIKINYDNIEINININVEYKYLMDILDTLNN